MVYPVNLELDSPADIANWRPLVHWLLDIPHAGGRQPARNVGGVIAVISWFAIVFTGRLPEGRLGRWPPRLLRKARNVRLPALSAY